MVQVKDLASGNLWLWERGKFMNRRYIMQEMYQQFIDDDQSWKDIKKEDVSFGKDENLFENLLFWKICTGILSLPSTISCRKTLHIQDPFWDEVEDYAIGSSSAFLQSLSYGLDFEDKLALTDHRGTEQGQLSIVLTPCEKNGKPLGEDHFVEDPQDLLNKGNSPFLS